MFKLDMVPGFDMAMFRFVIFTDAFEQIFRSTRKYPLRGYILGVLTHTTAWDRHWGGGKTLKGDFVIERLYPLCKF